MTGIVNYAKNEAVKNILSLVFGENAFYFYEEYIVMGEKFGTVWFCVLMGFR